MKKSFILLSIVCFVSIASSNADALDFGDHFYGKANFSVGYAYQKDKSKGITDLTDNAESMFPLEQVLTFIIKLAILFILLLVWILKEGFL